MPLSEQVLQLKAELDRRETELGHSYDMLNTLYGIADGLSQAGSELQIGEIVLQRALNLPGVRAGWITLADDQNRHRLLTAINLPPALAVAGAFNGGCLCRRKLLAGDFDFAVNILECERLRAADSDTRGLRYHASVPLRHAGRVMGLMNLVGPDMGMFSEAELKILHGVGNQLASALDRVRQHQNLERLVEERTSALTAEVAERTRAEQAQARLVAIIESTPDLVSTTDPDGNVLYCNQAMLNALGEVLGADVSKWHGRDAYPRWANKLMVRTAIPAAIENGSWSGEIALLGPDGMEIPVFQTIIAHQGPDGAVEYLSSIARDISLQKAHEKHITRLNRVYALVSGINDAIVRVTDRQALFDLICRIAVERGGFRMAALSLIDRERLEFIPQAHCGFEDGYADAVMATDPESRAVRLEVLAQAMRDKTPNVYNDIQNDPRMNPLGEQALARGYRSAVVLPLVLHDETIGVLALYSSDLGAFDAEELALLEEVADNVTFALDNIAKSARLDYLAYYEPVSGLPNRRLLYETLGQRIASAQQSGRIFKAIVINVLKFGLVNEMHGRSAGDRLLAQIGRRLVAGVDSDHLIAHLGGDSFAMVTAPADRLTAPGREIETILSVIEDSPFELDGKEWQVTAKAGVAVFPDNGGDADGLIRNAEAALRGAKFSEGRFAYHSPELNDRVAARLTLEGRLRHALDRDQFILHYQPKIGVKTGLIQGFEALIRWNDPDSGLTMPQNFIPILEENGQILEVGRWVMEAATAQFQQWADRGLRPPRLSVNVSPLQMRQPNFVDTVKRALEGVTDKTSALELELTESVFLQDVEANIAMLHAIRLMGVEVALDDFGTGYSSLSHLARLPLNSLKIDQTFIVNMVSNPADLSIVSAILTLGRSLDLKVVAEGVETIEQANLLKLLKCDEIQGYLVSRPAPAADVEAMIGGPPIVF